MRGLACAVAALVLFSIPAPGNAMDLSGAQGPECSLGALERQLVQEIVTELFSDAVWVAESTHGVERGFALSLVGADAGNIGHVTRIGTRDGAETFVPFCERDFELPIIRCSRLACEATGVDTIEVSVSGGKPKYKKRTTLEYAASTFAGTVVYDPYPTAIWRAVEHAPDTYSVSASLFRRPVATPTGGSPVDLTHSGSVTIKVVAGEITSLEMHLAFPALVASEPQILVDLSFDAKGVGTGSIRRGAEILATLAGNRDLTVIWEGTCSP